MTDSSQRPAKTAGTVPIADAATPSRAERRTELIRQRRDERIGLPARQKQEQSLKRIGLVVLALLIVAAVGYGVYSFVSGQRAAPQLSATGGSLTALETFPDPGAGHVDGPVAYAQTPPVGGPHSAYWQNCGYYSAPVANEPAVHALEHGAVWITYQPDLPQDQIDILRGLAENQTYILVSPFPDLPSPVVASAWRNQLKVETANSPDLAAFIEQFRQGPQTPEPGAACTGGTSETV